MRTAICMTHLHIFHIEVAESSLGQLKPSMFVIHGGETLLVLSPFDHRSAFHDIVQPFGHQIHFCLKGFAARSQR